MGEKRKRASGLDKPRKTPSGTVSVTWPQLKDELHPVIASTPGLSFPSASFKPYAKLNADYKSSSTPNPSTHSVLLHSSSHPKLDYTAHSDPNTLLSHYIGVYDPTTSSLKVVPAHAVTLRSTLRSETAEVRAQNEQRSFAQQRLELGMEFGTKKAKKAIASKTENAITTGARDGQKPDAVEAAVLDSVKEASNAMPERQELQDSVLAAKPIPKPNLGAEKVEDVYPVNVLVPAAEMRNLAVKDWQDAVAAKQNVKLSSRFVANRLGTVAHRNNVQTLKALRYLLLLLDFNAALRPAGKNSKKLPMKEQMRAKMGDWPQGLVDGVRKRFSQGGELSKWHVDNLMTHIAALSLFVDNWRTDTNDLREDLRLENKQMSQYFHELGCKVAPPTEKETAELGIGTKAVAAQRRIAKLKLPLDFPKTRNPPRRR